MYSDVLLPTDGSDGSLVAAESALAIVTQFGAAAHALFVIDERHVLDEYDLAVEAAEAAGERALEAVERAGSDRSIAVEKHLRRGVPHEEILAAVADHDIDLVVMGTHGRTGLDRLIHLGSVTERVVRRAPVPVLVVPLREPPESG